MEADIMDVPGFKLLPAEVSGGAAAQYKTHGNKTPFGGISAGPAAGFTGRTLGISRRHFTTAGVPPPELSQDPLPYLIPEGAIMASYSPVKGGRISLLSSPRRKKRTLRIVESPILSLFPSGRGFSVTLPAASGSGHASGCCRPGKPPAPPEGCTPGAARFGTASS